MERPPEQGIRKSSPNGIRTRVSTLRGWCPRPLDDGAVLVPAPGSPGDVEHDHYADSAASTDNEGAGDPGRGMMKSPTSSEEREQT